MRVFGFEFFGKMHYFVFAKLTTLMKRLLPILFFFILPVLTSLGRDLPYAYIPLSVEDGLSQPTVMALLSDRRGSLWIGTRNGLNLFDRQEIQVYTAQSDSLPANFIRGLAESPDGTLWVLTSRGISRRLPGRDRFETVLDRPCFSSLALPDAVYFGGDGVLYRFASGLDTPEPLSPFGEALSADDPDSRIVRMLELGPGEILLGTDGNGLFRFVPGKTAELFTLAVHPSLTSLYRASSGDVYAAFYGDGVYRYGPDGQELAHFTTSNSGLSNDYVQDFAEYDGWLWMSTDGGGISLLSLSDGSFETLLHKYGQPRSLPSNSVTVLYPDPSGALWAGTVKHGFFQIRRSYVRTFRDQGSGLVDKAVTSLYRDGDGTLWVGTDGGGIHRFDEAANRLYPLPGTSGKVLSIAGYDSRRLLVSLFMEGFFLVDRKTGRKEPFILVDQETNRRACFIGYLPRVGQVSADKLYILSHRPFVYDLRDRKFRRMEAEGKDTPVDGLRMACSDAVRSFFYRDGQVFLVRQEDDVIRPLFTVPDGGNVTALAFDGRRTLWVGSDRGLGRYDLDTAAYQAVPTSLFDSVSALELDADGRLWICARNHFLTYLCDEGRFISWSASDGFRPNDIKMLFQNATDPAYLYMGGSGGLVQVDRTLPVPLPETLPIFLDQLDVNGTSALSQLEGISLRLPWNYRSLSASFLVKGNDAFQRILFRYTVRGSQSRTFDSYDSRLTLPTLSPGTYEILVSCMTKGGDFTEPAPMLEVTVLPPWYRTIWFHALLAVLLAVLLAWVVTCLWRRKEHENKSSMAHFLEGMLEESKEATPSSSDPEFRRRLDAVILENLSNPDLDVKFLTEKMLMSRTVLYDKVKQETGLGIKDYINRTRIERSVELLLHTDMTISEIAYEVGFSYPRYFSTSFKNMKGVTPTRFKQENRSNNPDTKS
jgi:ligand-binding sensor domain-containing protein/AraC-like DNA-binding protein